jgi:hypothetical protein
LSWISERRRSWRRVLRQRGSSFRVSAKQIAIAGNKKEKIIMPDNWKQQANAHFRTLPETATRKIVISDSEAGAAAVAINTARLKGLRLARDAAEQAAPQEVVPTKKSGSKKKPLATLL